MGHIRMEFDSKYVRDFLGKSQKKKKERKETTKGKRQNICCKIIKKIGVLEAYNN